MVIMQAWATSIYVCKSPPLISEYEYFYALHKRVLVFNGVGIRSKYLMVMGMVYHHLEDDSRRTFLITADMSTTAANEIVSSAVRLEAALVAVEQREDDEMRQIVSHLMANRIVVWIGIDSPHESVLVGRSVGSLTRRCLEFSARFGWRLFGDIEVACSFDGNYQLHVALCVSTNMHS